jgi:hypothetical protein
MSRVILRTPPTGGWRIWWWRYLGRVRDGQFELHGLDPETEVPVFFLDSQHELGATVQLSGKSAAGGPVTVRLERCGTAKARLVGPGGKPVERSRASIGIVVTPASKFDSKLEKADRLPPVVIYPAGLDPTHYETPSMSDAQGRVVFPDLIPGATYRVRDNTTLRDPGDPTSASIRKEFTAKPGETLDLGDVLIAKPRQ